MHRPPALMSELMSGHQFHPLTLFGLVLYCSRRSRHDILASSLIVSLAPESRQRTSDDFLSHLVAIPLASRL